MMKTKTSQIEKNLTEVERITGFLLFSPLFNGMTAKELREMLEPINQRLEEHVNQVKIAERKAVISELKLRLELLMPKHIAEELKKNIELYNGSASCVICGTDPSRQREMILSTIDSLNTEQSSKEEEEK